MIILAVDPGTIESAFVVLETGIFDHSTRARWQTMCDRHGKDRNFDI